MSIETPNSAPKSNERNDISTPSADQVREAVHPDLKKSWIDKHVDTRAKKMLALGAIGSVVLGGGAASYAALDHIATQNEQEAPNDNGQSIYPSAEASVEPSSAVLSPSPASPTDVPSFETMTPVSPHEELVKSLEIKAGQEPNEIAQDLVDLISKWCMAGSEEATAEKMLGLGYAPTDRELYTNKLAAEQKEVYAEALFGKNWQDNDKVREFVAKQEKVNAGVLLRYLITSNDAIPFSKTAVLENYAFLSGDSMNGKFIVDSIVQENTDSIPKLIKLGFPNENDGMFTLTASYQTADEKVTISSIG